MNSNVQLDLDAIDSVMGLYQSGEIKASTMGYIDGFGLGWPQELQARIKAGSWDSQEYDEELSKLEKQHRLLKDEFPAEYMGGQAMGTMTNPAVIYPGTAAFRGVMGAVKSAPTFLRWLAGGGMLGLESAAIGGIEGAGRSDPGRRSEGGEFGAKLGAILGIGGGAAVAGGGKLIGRLVKWFKQNDLDNLGKKAIAEIQYMANKERKTPDQYLLEVIETKRPVVELSPAMQQLARYVAVRSPGARTKMAESITGRVQDTTRALDTEMKGTLGRPSDYDAFQTNNRMGTEPTASINTENMETTIRELNKDLKLYTDEAYEKAYVKNPRANQALRGQTTKILELDNGLANELNSLVKLRTKKKNDLVKIEKGKISWLRQPTLEEVEILRKGLSSKAGRMTNEWEQATGELAKDLKGSIDKQSPALSTARSTARSGKLAKEAFASTKGVLSKSDFDKFIDNYGKTMSEAEELGEETVNLVKSYYRYGLQNEINKQMKGSSKLSFVKKISNPDSKENKIIRTIYPEGKIDELLKMADSSAGALASRDKVLGGSPTAPDEGNVSGLDAAVNDMRNQALMARSGDTTTLGIDLVARAIKKVFGGNKMPDRQLMLMSQFLTERRPEVAKRLLEGKFNPTDQRVVRDLSRWIVSGGAGATSAGAQGIMNRPQ